VIASAAIDDQVAVVPYGRGNFLAAIDLRQATGDITKSHRLWEMTTLGADVPTPIIHDQQVLLLTDKGQVHCLDKTTGDPLWDAALPKSKDHYFASPVLAGNTLYCAREDGMIFVGKVSKQGLEIVAASDMDEATIATPIPIRGKLLVRGEQHLFLIGK
jgi:outer membrane protein assembly factor BamB